LFSDTKGRIPIVKMLQSKDSSKIFGPKREEATGGCRKLCFRISLFILFAAGWDVLAAWHE
jgi:hypothetical protein